MARPLRVWAPGIVHHVIARGNDRALIYRDDLDREAFVELLSRVLDRYSLVCHAYCLMGNHYHLALEASQPNLPLAIKQLNGVYARRFNRRHDRCGHLFQARHRAIVVEKQTHLLELCRYIVLNPVRAGLCPDPAQWEWSSYRGSAGVRNDPLLTGSDLLSLFASPVGEARVRYRRFVLDGKGVDLEEEVRGERLGSDAFMRATFCAEAPSEEIPSRQLAAARRPLADIFGAEAAPIAAAYRECGYRLREIAEYLDCHYATVSRKLSKEEATLKRKALPDRTTRR